ncbi:MAG: TetR/AcrR family transcriptional regulator [Chloroflexota bacterium]|nr:TetR/AcrR family transcriptional regulator [Chloroflexota bacterium]
MSAQHRSEQDIEATETNNQHSINKSDTLSHTLTPVTARGEATRRKILDAAEEVFGETGYYEASISEITRRAGVAQGTYYIYFHSKREIFAELVVDIGKRLRADIREAIMGATGRLDAERRGFRAFFQFVATHRRIYSIVQEAERVAPEAAQAYYRGISQGYIRGLNEAMAEGSIRNVNAEAVTYALMGIGHFVALRWLVWPQQPATELEHEGALPEEVFEAAMEFITRGLAVDATPEDQKA